MRPLFRVALMRLSFAFRAWRPPIDHARRRAYDARVTDSANTGRPAANPLSELIAITSGHQRARALMVAVELGIADQLRDGARTVDDLAAVTGTHAPTLYRLLRALAAIGVFEEQAGQAFALTPMSQFLRSDASVPYGNLAHFFAREYQWRAWGALEHSVRTGENAARHVLGMDVWAYREQHPEENAIFNAAMLAATRMTAALEAALYDFSSARSVVDIAGGTGAMLVEILRANPHLRGVLFDQPHVVAEAGPVLEAAGMAERVVVESGSFFEKVPGGHDVYVLRRILHDWMDKEALEILRCVRAAMEPSARLLVIDAVVGPPNQDASSKFFDLLMLVSAGGRERTEPEWRALLADGGFRTESIQLAGARTSVIVAAPA